MKSNSFAGWLAQLRVGDDRAVQRLWEDFFQRLVGLARGRLQTRFRRIVDEEDIALSAFDSFCRRAQEGRFPDLSDRDDLWNLLVTIAVRKISHRVRDQRRQKRGGDRPSGGDNLLDQFVGKEPTPELAAQLVQDFELLLRQLDSEELVQLALWKFEGYTNDEIAAKWDIAPRTVERKLRLIRGIWEKEACLDA